MLKVTPSRALASLVLLVCSAAGLVAQAADPASGTLSLDTPALSFTSGPSLVSDPVSGPCPASAQCDRFDLTVDLPADFATTNPSATIRILLTAQIPAEDYDLYLLSEDGGEIGSSGNAPPSSETIITPAGGGSVNYRVEVLPYAVTGGTADVTITLDIPVEEEQPDQPVATGLPPRFYYNQSPNGVANGAGEPTIGFNPNTGRVMFIAGLEPVQINFVENLDTVDVAGNPLPPSCEPVWESRPYTGNVNTLDPILETEQSTGRTFQSQLSGANSVFSITDDDGDTWIPGQVGPPNGGADHQTVGSGPYSPDFVGVPNPDGYAVYYCSQSVAAAFCARSDDGGVTFGAGVPMFNPALDCGGSIGALHGHVQVSPDDGTVYVPFGDCGGEQAVAVSEDSGTTWSVKTVPETLPGDDPGVGVGADGTLYFCYVNDSDGQPRMAVSDDKGDTFISYRNLAAGHDIANAVFPTAVAGDGDRAACAWLGTDDDSPGATASGGDFPGFWYPYVSVTYDRGNSFHTVNLSPTDPVQGAGGICLAGTTCGNNRNLLDFNDIQIDDQGRVLFGHSDGCIGTCVANPARNTFSDNGVLARQSGGRTLFAAFDDQLGTLYNSTAPSTPAAACLLDSSVRDTTQAALAWNKPDDGGAAITSYDIYRAEDVTGPYALVGSSDRETYTDPTVDPAITNYYYRVVANNNVGAAAESNTIELPVEEIVEVDTCTLPGDRFILDALGDGGAPDTDIEYIAVAELPDSPDFLSVTYKVDSFTAGQPPASSFYPLLFQNLLGDGVDRYFAVNAAAALPQFEFGTYVNQAAGVLTFTVEGDLEGAISADGTMVMQVPRSFFGGTDVGEAITGFDARARVGSSTATSRDTAGPGGYVVRGTALCTASGLIRATLNASTNAGNAPLDVVLTVSGTPTDGEALDSYTLDFGDGQSTSGSFGGQSSVAISHTYTAAGNYRAVSQVIDTSGAQSSEPGAAVIEVSDAGVTPTEPVAGKGGALGGAWLLLAGLAALLRRRR